MNIPTILGNYILWHYSEALADIFRIIGNFTWFFNNMFSIPLLLQSFFSPFKRLEDASNKKSWSFEDWGGRIIINNLMRLVGMLMRTIVIAIGLISIIITIIAGAFIFLVWLILPFAVIIIFLAGLGKLFFIF